MKTADRCFSVLAMAVVLTFAACEEDTEQANVAEQEEGIEVETSIAPPTLSAIDSEVATLLKFGVEVSPAQVNDTVYYLILPANVEGPSDGEELANHEAVTILPMAGRYFRSTYEAGLQEETSYVVYAVVMREKNSSEITSLAIITGSTDTGSK